MIQRHRPTIFGPVALIAAAAAAAPLPTGPAAGDEALSPFYRWTGATSAKPGTLLRREALAPDPTIAAAASAERILYASTDARWQSGFIPVSGSLYMPRGEAPAGGWPLVAWAHGTLGVADRCAPSWIGHKPRDATYINRWLDAGYAVVATDYQGLGGPGPHPYLFWEAEGRSILDGIRAAIGASDGRIANTVYITGQSQGSGSALGATRIAPTYAPDVHLRATVATGVLPVFPDGPYKLPAQPTGGSPHYTVLRLIGGSIPDGGPTADALMSGKGKPLLAAGRTGCTPEMRAVAERDGITNQNAFVKPVAAIEADLTPAMNMTPVRMPVPVLLGAGLADDAILPRRQYAAAMALCSAGSAVTWKAYPGISHNGSPNAAFPDALAFFRAVGAGRPPASDCGRIAEPGEPQAPRAGVPFNN
ncbi:MAG: hypothetical protein PGN09_03840 [Sphingomonas fennica]